jgi:hypothetical protein
VKSLERLAVESFAREVQSVAGELAAATSVERFADALAELVELASDCRVLVPRRGHDKLAIGEFLIGVERASGCEKSGRPL